MKWYTTIRLAFGGLVLGSSAAATASDAVVNLTPIWTYETGVFDDSAAEIPAYDRASGRLFVTNSADSSVDILDVETGDKIGALDVSPGSPNGVAVGRGLVAVAVEASLHTDPGSIMLFNAARGFLITTLTVGPLPDMVTFSPDGNYLIVANEGEPNDDYSVDPEGSISVIALPRKAWQVTQADVSTADFTAFNAMEEDLVASGVRIFGPGATVAQDLEPEYVAVSPDSTTAWVSLQENNALAVVDLASATVTAVVPLGFKDHMLPGQGIDASDRDGMINIANWPVLGMFQPDAIAAYESEGNVYLVTANEGDARDYDTFSEEERVKNLLLDEQAFPNFEELQEDENLGRLTVTTTLGDTDGDEDFDQLYAFGTRSFSIWSSSGSLLFDSGDDFEQITAMELPDDFNSNNDENGSFDSRSDAQGPEPEGLVLATARGRSYAFVGLERIGGIMTYDITNPVSPSFAGYVNNRDFSGDPEAGTAGDLGPEGLVFIRKFANPLKKDLLIVTNEVSGTTTAYEVEIPSTGLALLDFLLDLLDFLNDLM